LRYAMVTADRVGVGLTLLGLVGLVLLVIFPRTSPAPVIVKGPALKPAIAVFALALSVSLWSWWNNSERIYKQGHELLSDEQYVLASRAFDRAYSTRNVPGKKAEALFWAGRSFEFVEEHAGALDRYRELARLYPDNYWAAESLYRIMLLERQVHNERGAQNAYKQLLQDFPDNTWTEKAIKAAAAKP